MKPASELITSDTCLLLDFDGPVCSVFSGLTNREAAQRLIADLDAVPTNVAETIDPFDVLHFAATRDAATGARIEELFTEIEIEAVRVARPTSGAHELIHHAAAAGHIVAIVSNNSMAAINDYLVLHQLRHRIRGIFARTTSDLSQLKPSPYLLDIATTTLEVSAERCVFIGDSTTDIHAARAAGVPVIAYANKPDKLTRFLPLAPNALVNSMFELEGTIKD
ncbi:HAD family hydrolase [Nocardia higoensis]|uniref:HAD family hydrolase n=1 Tax=Nocardia higoensis TaxID=228599 RepID=A0ABS0DC72_9NOCA|nr:HAD-IA family hydrolase [Nocardia higoensis]MBF6356064.1 HAD family hydrolase [Nocardia higoensis]